MSELTPEYLQRIFHYDSETGVFTRKYREDRSPMWNGRHAGKVVGTNAHGYIKIALDYKEYMAHRLAWIYMTGETPDRIDHINHARGDNRFSNIRNATQSQNGCNRGMQKNNTTGYKGVHLNKRNKRYSASIKFMGDQIHLGYYDTPQQAHIAYSEAANKYHGEFARAS